MKIAFDHYAPDYDPKVLLAANPSKMLKEMSASGSRIWTVSGSYWGGRSDGEVNDWLRKQCQHEARLRNTATTTIAFALTFICSIERIRRSEPNGEIQADCGRSQLTIGVFNTSIASETPATSSSWRPRRGKSLNVCRCPDKIQLIRMRSCRRASFRLQKKIAFNVACGTNLLHSHMEIVKQWNVGLVASWFLKPVVLSGVGWRGHAAARRPPTQNSSCGRSFPASISIRYADSYTEGRLRELGFSNVINTACPTMWD